MKLSLSGRRGGGAVARRGRRDRRADRAKLIPQSECLEARLLLSSAAHVTHADLLSPPALEVANATAVLESRAGQDFQKLSADLQRLEQASGVRPGQFALLESDVTTMDLAIKSSSELASKQSSLQLDALQNVLDQSFLAASNTGSGWNQLEQKVSSDLYGVVVNDVLNQAEVAAIMPNGVISNQKVQDTYDQMKVIAREAHVKRAEHDQIVADEQAIVRDLGPAPDMNLGGAAPRDPLTVYLDSQVPNFVHAPNVVRRR
ncbi:MAG TPA: hypothetical protein VJY33_21940 [Isosphaeraceae bacterium]|nr:hypothetical protein [Isosphaeraceae bacterium]